MAAKTASKSVQQVQRGAARADGKPCEVCGAATRKMFARTWWKCLNGHRLVRKTK